MLCYGLSPIMSPRVFTVLQVKQLGEVDSKREGYALISFSPLVRRLNGRGSQTYRIIVSIPIDLSSPEDETLAALEEKGVRGRYASVERILELPGDKVEWRMATSSSAGGLIPQFLTNFVLPEAVSKVILNFLMRSFATDWIFTRPGCTFVFEVDGSEEDYDRELEMIRVEFTCLERHLTWLVSLSTTTEVPRPSMNKFQDTRWTVAEQPELGPPATEKTLPHLCRSSREIALQTLVTFLSLQSCFSFLFGFIKRCLTRFERNGTMSCGESFEKLLMKRTENVLEILTWR